MHDRDDITLTRLGIINTECSFDDESEPSSPTLVDQYEGALRDIRNLRSMLTLKEQHIDRILMSREEEIGKYKELLSVVKSIIKERKLYDENGDIGRLLYMTSILTGLEETILQEEEKLSSKESYQEPEREYVESQVEYPEPYDEYDEYDEYTQQYEDEREEEQSRIEQEEEQSRIEQEVNRLGSQRNNSNMWSVVYWDVSS